MPDTREIKYVLFCHLPDKLKAWEALGERARDLGECLDNEVAPGMLVVFFEPGWLSLLNTIGADFDPEKMASEFDKIRLKELEVQAIIKRVPKLNGRLRLVTAKQLNPILNNLRGNKPGLAATRLRRFLVGDDPGVRYDTTKVVEAIIRVRHLGSGIPILRMDWDALLNDHTLPHLLPVVTRDIPHECRELGANHRIHSYMISGSYTQPTGKDSYADWDINDFNTSFATRMFPALIPTRDFCARANKSLVQVVNEGGLVTDVRDCDLDDDVLREFTKDGLFDSEVMLNYFGLSKPSEGLASLGSDPIASVISGSALVISEGAILDLPPFSNLRQNVMWIDDYLKYELHRALGHFSEARVSDPATMPGRYSPPVYKDRLLGGQGNIRRYVFADYLPTVFWGVMVDGWIRGEPLIKDTDDKSAFVVALERALKRGAFEDGERERLASSLTDTAIKRVNSVIRCWSALVTSVGAKSFAALWVGGDKTEIERVMDGLPSPKECDDWLGWGIVKSPAPSIASLSELRAPYLRTVNLLIEDMCTYIDWALEWPTFIQSVRAVPNGELSLDVGWPRRSAWKSSKK